MNKAFEKILEKLDETDFNDIQMVVREVLLKYGFPYESVVQDEVWDALDGLSTNKFAKKIVQEVAEEFATDTNVGTNGWIPCSERLPKKNGMYLCTQNSYDLATNKNIIRVSTELVEFYNGKWRRAKNLVVTHWQPLPEPFKERD